MTITHFIDDFFIELFPQVQKNGIIDKDQLKISLESYYAHSGIKPDVLITDTSVTITIDIPKILAQENDFRRLTNLCEKGKFAEAKPLVTQLIKNNPTNSEYYRIYGQILSDEGNTEEAINQLIDALCWDPNNKWALIMMANIFAKAKNDIQTAMKYYDQAIKIDPNNGIAINNIGAVLMEKRKFTEAKKYFYKALEIDSTYPNTYFGLSLIYQEEGNLTQAFQEALLALKYSGNGTQLYKNALSQALTLAQEQIKVTDIDPIVKGYAAKLEVEGNTEIEIQLDETIPTVAKLEIAENYNRDKHIIKYKPGKPGSQHLIMHELVHLDLVFKARAERINKLYTSTQETKRKFLKFYEKDVEKLHKKGISEANIANFMSDMFDGLNRQVFNTPIDLFIEDYLYKEFPQLRPFQFISLYLINKEGVEAVTTTKGLELIPAQILRTSKIYNIINSLHFQTLFSVDFVKDLKATQLELGQAKGLYEEYSEYRNDRGAGEEYELVQNWGDDLKMSPYFELVDEEEYRKRSKDVLSRLDEIESDPYGLRHDPYREAEMKQFIKTHTNQEINMAVAMYMVGALEKYYTKSPSEIQPVAFEIAQIGITGISPEGKNYKVSFFPRANFTGYQLLAYYYVTWKLFNPAMHQKLGLPFDKEYELALQFYQLQSKP